MANTNLSNLKHVLVPSTLHFYYDVEDGANVLRHIRVNGRTFEVPADGVTIDVPEGSIGSREIKDGDIAMTDLAPAIRQAVQTAADLPPMGTEEDVRNIVTDYEPDNQDAL